MDRQVSRDWKGLGGVGSWGWERATMRASPAADASGGHLPGVSQLHRELVFFIPGQVCSRQNDLITFAF